VLPRPRRFFPEFRRAFRFDDKSIKKLESGKRLPPAKPAVKTVPGGKLPPSGAAGGGKMANQTKLPPDTAIIYSN